nr:4490_t:CDS:2 [Entrophospora candida]
MKTLGSDSSYKPLYITDVSREKSEVSSSTSRDSSNSRETANSDAEISNDNATLLQLSESKNIILTKFQELWWIQGNMHPSAKWEEAFDVDWEKYSERTDMFDVHGNWEWIDRKVYVYELPLRPHEICSSCQSFTLLDNSNMLLIIEYIKGTKVGAIGKEANGSYIPWGKPRANSNGCEGPDSYKPWPNLVIEIASSETEKHLLNAVKNYWLYPGRAHDAIAVNISTKCLFHGMPSDFHIPASISNPLIIDFYEILHDMEEELRIS